MTASVMKELSQSSLEANYFIMIIYALAVLLPDYLCLSDLSNDFLETFTHLYVIDVILLP